MRRLQFCIFVVVVLLATLSSAALGQDDSPVVETEPAIPVVTEPVTIYFNADQGNGGLKDFDGAVYAHTGVFTDQSPNDWKCVKTDWPNNRPDIRLERIEANRYKLEIDDIRAYYNDNETSCTLAPDEEIQTMNFVFRNGDGTREGKTEDGGDIIVELGDPSPGVQARIETPTAPALNPLIVDTDTTLEVLAVANAVETEIEDFTLFVDGTEAASTANDSLYYDLTLDTPGRTDVTVEVRGTDGSVAGDTLAALRVAPTAEEPVPAGMEDGINYTSSTSATLVLQAPRKDFVHVIGDFTDWDVQPEYQMKRETNTATTGQDSTRWWITIDGLQPDEDVGFQYLVDGELRIPDPYAEKVLSPNDEFISASTYPNLKPYPEGQTEQLVAVLQLGQSDFEFSAFDRPDSEDLVIYELLVRDFIEAHDFQTMQDTLAYLERLGVNAIELMPVSEFDGNESWGYNPSMHLAPDKYYGPAEELKRFIELAHQRGIAVILDVVYNHATGQSPLVRLFNEGTFGPPIGDNPWANPEARHPFNVFNDLNHESVFTKHWLDRANAHWLTAFNVDGFRFDLSKGFTQTDTRGDVAAWSSYDQSRIDLLQRMADQIWQVDDEAYIILEHFAEPDEEKELAEYKIDQGRPGMLLWNNMNREYSQSAMGFIDATDFPSDLSNTYFRNRGLDVPNYITYMESHDEQWLMHRNREFGNGSDEGYSVQDLGTALERQKLIGAFFFTVPGPRMLWQFGELGYGWASDECLKPGGGDDDECIASAPGRTEQKPIRWDYRDPDQHSGRVQLYQTWSALINLRNQHEVFTDPETEVDLRVGQGEWARRIGLSHPSMDVVVAGNFDLDTLDVTADFPSSGTWYDVFTGTALSIEPDEQNDPIPMAPGEFHVYTSEPVDFPEAGLVPYAAAAPPPPMPGDLQSDPDLDAGTIRLSWTESEASDLTSYQIYRGTSADFDTTGARIAALGPEITSYEDTDVALDEVNYYRVVALDNDGMRSASEPVEATLYPQTVVVSSTRSFGEGAASSDYRLIALPGAVDRGLAETFDGEPEADWLAYRDDGTEEDYLKKFDGSATFDFAPGRGFWAISTSMWSVEDELPTVPLEATDAGPGVSIDLHEGWNIISNPLDRGVPWNRVEAANGDVQPLWRFDGQFSTADTFATAASGEAFYFHNQQSRDALVLPIGGGSASDVTAKRDESTTFALTAQTADGTRSTVQVGTSAAATDGVGPEDIIGPPADFASVSLRVQAVEIEESDRRHALVRSLRPAGEEGYTFDLLLRADAEEPIQLTADSLDAIAGGAVRLIARATGEVHDLREASPVELTPKADSTQFVLLVGRASYVDGEQARLVPEELALAPNYPNPFREQTTLEYTLPEAGRVMVTVYDLLGRRVRVLVDERQEAGRHQVQWTGRNDAGQPVASGLYIGRIEMEGAHQVQKMTLVR